MAVDHVEVALVDGHIDRLADRAAGMVQPWARLRQLDQIAEVLDRAVAPALVEIHDEGRPIGRGEDDVVAADLDIAGGIAGVLCELPWCRGDDFLEHAGLEGYAHAIDLGAGPLPMVERLGVVAELDADLGKDTIGDRFDTQQALFAEDIVGRDVADDVGNAEASARAFAPLRS
ncbi:hypothetical protein D9M72_440570 [compost metagenome]